MAIIRARANLTRQNQDSILEDMLNAGAHSVAFESDDKYGDDYCNVTIECDSVYVRGVIDEMDVAVFYTYYIYED